MLIGNGLQRYVHKVLANEQIARSMALLEHLGFWEFYHAVTGQGLGGKTFSWATIILDMAASAQS